MVERFSQLRCKEVINVADGKRIGYVSDLEIDTECGRILALIVPGPGKFFGLFPSSEVYVIPWSCISRMGCDILLVDVCPSEILRPREKRHIF